MVGKFASFLRSSVNKSAFGITVILCILFWAAFYTAFLAAATGVFMWVIDHNFHLHYGFFSFWIPVVVLDVFVAISAHDK